MATRKTKAKTQPGKRAVAAARATPGISLRQMREELNIVVDLIPRTNSNRPGIPLHPSKITIHNTDNDDPGANARAHAQYMKGSDAQRRQVSWHFSVDDGSVYQSLPVDEIGWHAGNREGNRTTIGIEICQNRGIDQAAANDRAARLTVLMLDELGIDLNGNVVQHHDWSGKDCPALLRHPATAWANFLQKVADYYAAMSGHENENEHDVTPLSRAAGDGPGPGRDFQRLSKECPAFAAEFAAVGLRNIRSHWGPIITRKAEIRSACDQMFGQVQDAVDASSLCPVLA